MDSIVIRGAREHNLKNLSLTIPRNALVVLTGVSGSGKSSLAFDTLFAEGQRRYVESLSAYARQFLEQMEKPDVDSIEGLSPAISIEQRTTSKNPRSTVGTVTEIYDYLRLLYASIGKPHCQTCGKEIAAQTIQQMTDRILAMPEDTRFLVLAPFVRGKKGEYKKQMEEMVKQGFLRARVNGKMVELESPPDLDKQKKHTIEVVVDRLVVKRDDEARRRLADSLETATKVGKGLVTIATLGAKPDSPTSDETLSTSYACPDCGTSLTEITPRLFSFNSPFGACPSCSGLGTVQKGSRAANSRPVEIDPRRRDRAVQAGLRQLAAQADRAPREGDEVLARRAVQEARQGRAERDPPRLGGARDQVEVEVREGRVQLVVGLQGPRAAPRGQVQGSRERRGPRRARELHVGIALPGVQGPPAEARGARRSRGRPPHRHAHGTDARGRAGLLREARADGARAGDRGKNPQGDPRPPRIPERRRDWLPLARARVRDALGRRGATHPPRDADRVEAHGRPLRPRRAVHRPPREGQPQAHRHAHRDARSRKHGRRRGARRGDDPPCGPRRGPRAGRRHPRRRDRGGGPRGRAREVPALAHGKVPVRRAVDRRARAAPRRHGKAPDGGRRHGEQPQEHHREIPARGLHGGDGSLGLGEVDARERHPVPGRGARVLRVDPEAGGAPEDRRPRAPRQGRRHRPVAHRAYAPQQSGHVHERLQPDPRADGAGAGRADARLRPWALLVQREGRPLRELPRRRADRDRDALFARHLRHV